MEDMRDNFTALKSAFSGATDPADPVAGLTRLNTTSHRYGIRDEANNTYLEIWDMTNNKPILVNIVVSDIPAAMKDAAAATPSLRTLGTSSTSACAGNDSRLISDLVDGSVTGARLSLVSAGDYVWLYNDTARTIQSAGSYTVVKKTKLSRGGTFRMAFTLSGFESFGKIYRDRGGVVTAVGTERSAESSTTFTEDISGWLAGDIAMVCGKGSAITISYFTISTDEGGVDPNNY
jgi:hypothetical protein